MQVGKIPSDYFSGGANLQEGGKSGSDSLSLAQLLDKLTFHRCPSGVESAAFTAAANDTWEDVAIVTKLNAALTNKIRTDEAVLLLCTLEVINGEAAANTLKYGHGGCPDDDDTVRTFTTAAASASEFIRGVLLMTDDDGKIKFETADKTNVSVKVHLEGYQYIKTLATP